MRLLAVRAVAALAATWPLGRRHLGVSAALCLAWALAIGLLAVGSPRRAVLRAGRAPR